MPIALFSASLPFHIIVYFFTCVSDSPAQMYMPQLFTHCLPTIICVM